MKKHIYNTPDRPLWPDGIPAKFNDLPFDGLPITHTSNFKLTKATPVMAKKINITTKCTIP